MANYIAGLDIGSQSIKILVVNQVKGGGLEVAFQGQEEAKGVRRGVVISPQEVADILQSIVQKAGQDIGRKINAVNINVGGSHIFVSPSRGLISVSRADRKISEEDVRRVLQAAQDFSLPPNKEIFDTVPREFIIDGEKGIKEAVGLEGLRLEADVLVMGGFTPYLENLNQAVLGADLDISNRLSSPVASALACLSEKQKELGVALVDIGAGTTGLAVFEEGDLLHLAILPIGSGHITNDIAIGLKTDIEVAERIKIDYGTCSSPKSQKREKIDLDDGEALVFSQKQLVNIIIPRITQIFGEVHKELKKISMEKSLPSGIVLTGGGAKMPGIKELAKKELKLPVRIGCPQGIANFKDPSWSVCAGLVLNSADWEKKNGILDSSGILDPVKKTFRKLFKMFLP